MHKCSICNKEFEKPYHVAKHRRAEHLEIIRNARAKTTTPALEAIHMHEQGIQKALLALESDRQILHDKIITLDNIIARYKKFPPTTV